MSGPKEHPGGKPTVHVEWQDNTAFVVPSEEFNHAALDSPTDLVKEAIAHGHPIDAVIDGIIEAREVAIRSETVNGLISFIIAHEKPRLAAYALGFTCNVCIVHDLTPADVARRCGVAKQDVYQAVDRACKKLGVRKTSWMRDQEAKDRMSECNHRKGNPNV